MNRKWWLVLAASAVLALTAAACGSSDNSSSSGVSGDLAGAGSSAQQAAQEAWVAKFEDQNSGATVSYDPIGSGGGRDQFIAGGKTAFAGSDSPFDTTELPKATDRCTKDGGGQLIQIPNYISPIAIIYNLPGVDNLQLSPDTTAKIFKGEITTWDDPAIKADNPGVSLPSTKITPVHRSDESGTTANFTDYLHGAAPSVWTFDPDGNWPLKTRRVRRADVGRGPGGQGRRRHDRLRRREPVRGPRASPRSRLATPTWRRAPRVRPTISTSRRRTRSSPRRRTCSRTRSSGRRPTRAATRCCWSRT